jgi:CHAT domain-containing protein/tetratricopeptide (TPR) repeat protein
MTMRGSILIPLLLASWLAGCDKPPSDAYVAASASASKSEGQVSIGKNAVGEDCTQAATDLPGGIRKADVFCGTWTQPSATVRSGGTGSASELAQLATNSSWRTGINDRFRCEPPAATTILGGQPAQLLQCTRLVGGWAHAAIVAHVGGRIWFADGVLPAASVMERSIGVLAGVTKADAAPVSSAADALLAGRLAAQSFSADDVGRYDALMKAGTRANVANNLSSAETAFRAALSLQQKSLGKDNPNTVTPLMSLALVLSDEGKFAEADNLLDQAEKLVPKSPEPTARARLDHYRGLNALNQDKPQQALMLLETAERGYIAEVPPGALTAKAAPPAANAFASAGRLGTLTPAQDLLSNPQSQSAILGLIEARRNSAVALRMMNRSTEANAALQSANDVALGNGLARPIVTARLYRTMGITAAMERDDKRALQTLGQSTNAFDRALPGSKPQADTYLLYASQLVQSGRLADALPFCRSATKSLINLKVGTTPALMAPCLDAYANGGADQTVLAEMFTAAQLAQGGITSQQIAQASATLAENARDPKVAEAIRLQRDLKSQLDALYGKRDDLAQALKAGANQAGQQERSSELEKTIEATERKAAEADRALQAASPNYGQLVQETVKPDEVFKSLHANEAFVALTLSESEGWAFALRDGRIAVSRIAKGSDYIAKLVRRVRAGIELTTDLPKFDIDGARELYDLTLRGVAPSLEGAKAVVVAPTGPLLSLPFEVLLTGPAAQDKLAEAPWLIRQYTLAHVPAPSNFVSLRKIASGSKATQPWFGFGEFRPVTRAQAERSFPGATCGDSARALSGLPLLPYAKKELDAARLLLGANTSDELLGANFTAARVLTASLKNYKILQFSTHALLPTDLRCTSEPAIVTSAPAGAVDAKGALLTASQVVSMDLDADLVILSACNSGGPGGTTAGESLSGLARSFFYAGARSLLVTHWSVNDQVAAYLVADTLRRMRADPSLGITGSMRDSQLAMLAGAGKDFPPEIAHPFFWAPFAVIGEGLEHPAAARTATKAPGRAAL